MNNDVDINETVIVPKLNPYKARKDIKNVNDIICEIQRSYANSINNYFEKIYAIWTSPKAVDFYDKANFAIKSINESIIDFNEKTVREAVSSFNRIAPSHHESPISVSRGPYKYIEITKPLDKSIGGALGMVDKELDTVTKEFSLRIKNLKNKISSLPSSIHFYDVEGKLAGSYNINVSELNALINTSINKILILLNEVDDNIVATRRAVKNATSILS